MVWTAHEKVGDGSIFIYDIAVCNSLRNITGPSNGCGDHTNASVCRYIAGRDSNSGTDVGHLGLSDPSNPDASDTSIVLRLEGSACVTDNSRSYMTSITFKCGKTLVSFATNAVVPPCQCLVNVLES